MMAKSAEKTNSRRAKRISLGLIDFGPRMILWVIAEESSSTDGTLNMFDM
jgi:hypothetical protein